MGAKKIAVDESNVNESTQLTSAARREAGAMEGMVNLGEQPSAHGRNVLTPETLVTDFEGSGGHRGMSSSSSSSRGSKKRIRDEKGTSNSGNRRSEARDEKKQRTVEQENQTNKHGLSAGGKATTTASMRQQKDRPLQESINEAKSDVTPVPMTTEASASGEASIESIKRHYDVKTNRTRRSEEDSNLGALRKYNNLIKGIYIRMTKPMHVLDLACGHGQELLKFNKIGTLSYTGVDVSEKAIAEAKRRYDEFLWKGVLDFEVELKCADVNSADAFTIPAKMRRSSAKFNLACCNFALHYLVPSQAAALQLFSRVHEILQDGGLFAMTIVCSDTLEERMKSRGKTFGNEQYEVAFTHSAKKLSWGHRYNFRLGLKGHREGGISHRYNFRLGLKGHRE